MLWQSAGLCDTFIQAGPVHVLLARASSLAVTPVAGTGWSDWGSPARVFASLAGTDHHDRLLGRIRGDVAVAG